MKREPRPEAFRMLAMLALGITLGLAAGARIFQSTPLTDHDAGSGETRTASWRPSAMEAPGSDLEIEPVTRRDTETGAPRPASEPPPDSPVTITVPAESLARVPVAAFPPRRGNPWDGNAGCFEMTREVRELLQIDERTAGDIRSSLELLRDEFMRSEWNEPAHIAQTDQGVAVTIAPSPAEARERIERELRPFLKEEQMKLLMQYSAEAFDWEFGGFGRLERTLEVTVLPDDSLSIRESLRPVASESPGGSRSVETRVNQYRIQTIPPELARFVEIPDSQ